MAERCSSCGRYDTDMKRCSCCTTVFYCSRACQREHWPSHKVNCKLVSQDASEDSPNQVQQCANCKTVNGNLKNCAGCRAILYCSKSCQIKHWPKHKVTCNRPCRESNMETPKQSLQCENCKKCDEHLRRCTGCNTSAYCSKSCQRKDWPKHKWVCVFLRESKKSPKPSESQGSERGKQPDNDDGETCTYAVVRDNLTGALFLEKQCPTAEFSLPPVPHPGPLELSRMVHRLMTSLPHPMYFEIPEGEQFTYIIDLNDVMPEWYASVLRQERNTVLVAKIVEMDVYWTRHGICIKGDEKGKPVIVHFYMPMLNPLPFFKWSDAIPGNYICIRVPVFHSFLDGQVGFRIDHASHVRILSASGQLIFGI